MAKSFTAWGYRGKATPKYNINPAAPGATKPNRAAQARVAAAPGGGRRPGAGVTPLGRAGSRSATDDKEDNDS